MCITASYRWCVCDSGCLAGYASSRYQRLWPFIPNRGLLGTSWWLCMWGHPTVCLGLPCKVINQSIVGLSLLFETTYSTGHDITYWWNFVNITGWINCIVQFLIELVGTTRNGNQLEIVLKLMKVRTYSLLLFSKRTPLAKLLLMSRVWWCSYHPTVKSCWVLVYSALL
jgi:hypothetical protein